MDRIVHLLFLTRLLPHGFLISRLARHCRPRVVDDSDFKEQKEPLAGLSALVALQFPKQKTALIS